MEARELRIGNYVTDGCTSSEIYEILRLQTPEYTNWNSGDEYSVVGTILGEGINSCYDIKPIPIPLTEEWLLKFNWKKLDKYTFTLNGWFIYKRKRGFVTGSRRRELNIMYVHVLQNWWYSNNQDDLVLFE